MLPVFVAQMMTLRHVATQGLGHGLSPDLGEEAIDAASRRLAGGQPIRFRAANIVRLYDGYRSSLPIAHEVDDRLG